MRSNATGSRIKKFTDKLSARDWFFITIGMLILLASILTVALKTKPDVATSSEFLEIKNRGAVAIGLQSELPKFAYKDENGQITGLEVDIAHAIAGRIFDGDTTKVEIIPVTLNTRIPKLERKLADFSISTIPLDVSAKADYSAPYYWDAIGVMVRSDDAANSIKELSGKRIGVIVRPSIAKKAITTGKAIDTYAKDNRLTFDIKGYSSIPDLLDALTNKTIDGVVLEYALMQAYYTDEYKILTEAVATIPYCIAVRANDETMLMLANEVIGKLNSSGELKKLWEKWGLSDYR